LISTAIVIVSTVVTTIEKANDYLLVYKP